MVFDNKYFAPKLLVPTKEEMKLDSLVYPYNLEETKQRFKNFRKVINQNLNKKILYFDGPSDFKFSDVMEFAKKVTADWENRDKYLS